MLFHLRVTFLSKIKGTPYHSFLKATLTFSKSPFIDMMHGKNKYVIYAIYERTNFDNMDLYDIGATNKVSNTKIRTTMLHGNDNGKKLLRYDIIHNKIIYTIQMIFVKLMVKVTEVRLHILYGQNWIPSIEKTNI